MKEIPLLMRAPGVVATLEHRKIQTRRLLKQSRKLVKMPFEQVKSSSFKISTGNWHLYDADGKEIIIIKCPYGQPGDHLWLRETWGVAGALLIDPCMNYRADGKQLPIWIPPFGSKAMLDNLLKIHRPEYRGWHASIHMPRWASRILVENTGVRLQNLWEISEQDLLREGYRLKPDPDHEHRQIPLLEQYQVAWDNINRHTGYTFDTNPTVWVIDYKLHEVKDVHL